MNEKNDNINPTTVRLSERAHTAKATLTAIYGLKNVLSSGILLLDVLPPELREQVIEISRKPMPAGGMPEVGEETDTLLDDYYQNRVPARKLLRRAGARTKGQRGRKRSGDSSK